MSQQQAPTIIGTVVFIDPAENKSKKEGQSFMVAGLGVQVDSFFNGANYSNFFGFQITQQSAIDSLDQINVGDEVEVSYGFRGTLSAKPTQAGTPKNPESKVIYTNLTAFKIVRKNVATPETAAAAAGAKPTDQAGDLPF